jgi:hypothetical protein
MYFMARLGTRLPHDKAAMRLWFANLILYSAALTVTGQYVPFTEIGAAVMKMLADTRGIDIKDADKKEMTDRAVAAGWKGALIRRAGNDVLSVGPQPHIIGDDLDNVADQLIARHGAKSRNSGD